MRITNAMMVSNFLNNLNGNMSIMNTYQDQLASGRRMNKLSDDPIGLLSVLNSRSKLNKVETNTSAIEDARAWLNQSETSISEINDVLATLHENTVRAATGTMSESDRAATAQLVKEMKAHIVELGNASYGGRYIFGGYNTSQAPFTFDAGGSLLYNGVDLTTASSTTIDALANQSIVYATGDNVVTEVSTTGVELFGTGTDNLYAMLSGLQTALENPASTSADIAAFTAKIKTAQEDVLALEAKIGAKQNRLEAMQDNLDSNEINYTKTLSMVQDIDQAETTMQFKMAEAIYRAALEVGAKVIEPSLADFLR